MSIAPNIVQPNRLKNYCTITSSKRIYASDYIDEGIPFVRGKEVVQRFNNSGSLESELFISRDKFELLRDRFGAPNEGDLLLTSVGTLGVPYLVTSNDEFYFKDGNLIWFRQFEGLNSKFLYYWLQSHRGHAQLSKCTIGTSQSAYTIERLKEIELDEFSASEQNRIVSILSAYDDLIENNRRRIQLLEQAARLLYREWFVHLRFPGHEHVAITDGVPEGWEKKQVKDVLGKVKRPRKIKKSDFLKEGGIPCVDQSRDFIGGYTDDEEAVVDIGQPVIVFGDHTRILKFVDFPFACGADGTQLIVSNDEALSQEFLYFALDAIDLSNYFYARHFKFLKDQYIPRPPNMLLSQFTDNARPILKQIKSLRDHCHHLSKARDLLLPRLMNGEVAV